jgi:hypothetical protein
MPCGVRVQLLSCIFFISTVSVTLAEETHSYMPPHGMVPDRATALLIAEAVLFPIYGEEKIKAEYPLTVNLGSGVWTVKGTLPARMNKGGVAVIEISKENGCILRVSQVCDGTLGRLRHGTGILASTLGIEPDWLS